MIYIATVTAIVFGLAFLFLGQFILQVLGISAGCFALAGGFIPVVPIGTLPTMSSSTITTPLLLATRFPHYIVLSSFTVKILLTRAIFPSSNQIVMFMRKGRLNGSIKGAQLTSCCYRSEHDYPRLVIGWFTIRQDDVGMVS